ncbi:cell division protein FtsL [Schleiferilactobacillus perolens]|jgi:cell division protein FtsL|nr:cell division protein FtsL [Schleiferilactobacillus perolens]MCI2171304.1 cell division protein FtsL [Schleiferilactobacillus perolens]
MIEQKELNWGQGGAAPARKEAPAPKQQPNPVPAAQPVPGRVPLNGLERVLIAAIALISGICMLTIVSMQVGLTTTQRQYQNVTATVADKRSQNNDLQQEIGELTSSQRLNEFAKSHGLTLIEGNIRNIGR